MFGQLLSFAKGRSMKNLKKVLEKEKTKELALGSTSPAVQTGKSKHWIMSQVRPDTPDEGLAALMFQARDKADDYLPDLYKIGDSKRVEGAINPAAELQKIPQEGGFLKIWRDKNKPEVGADKPTLERILARIRNEPNVFFDDGSII